MKIISTKFIALLFILLSSIFITQVSYSQEISWNLTSGPRNNIGEYLNIYALGSTKNGDVFAGTNQHGVYKSSDSGITWDNCSHPLFINSTISYMVVDTNDVIYISSTSGLFKSSDYGNMWIQLNLSIPPVNFQSIAVNNSGLTYAGSYGIYRSLDYGMNWSFSGLDSCIVWVIKIFEDSTVVAGTFNYGPYISTDRGENWTSINNGLNHNQIIGLAISGSGELFVGVTGGVYHSINWGNSWNQILTISPIWAGVISIFADKYILAGSRGEGIFLSSDNGSNWNNINSGLENLYVNAFCGSVDGYIYAATDSGVFLTSEPIISANLEESVLANDFSLYQNYPNPFNPSTKISRHSPVGGWQTIKVFDVLGNEVAMLVDEYKPAGSYEVEWDASGFPSGVYFYQLKVGDFVETKKMLLMK